MTNDPQEENTRVRRLSFVVRQCLTLDAIWLLIAPVGLVMLLNISPVPPNDLWWHVRVGQIILSERYIPTTDLFSFTRPGAPWVNQAWLMQVALYLVYRAGGLPLIILAHALTITAGYTALLRAVTRDYGVRPGVLATLIGAFAGILTWVPRPQIISYLFFGVLVCLIENHRRGRAPGLGWAVPLFAVWANSHGGFVFGAGALGLYVAGRLWEFWRAGRPAAEKSGVVRLAALGLLSLAALSLNPQGPLGIIRYVAGFVQSDATVNYNAEFSALSVRELDGLLFWASNVFLVFLIARSGFRPRADQALSWLVFAALALLARRNTPWYGFVIAPMLAAGLQAWWKRPQTNYPGVPWMNGVIIGLLGLSLALTLPWVRGSLPLPPEQRELAEAASTPIAAVEFMCRELPDDARVYGYLAFNSYQVWGCPRLPVFIDTRFELYPLDQWLDYIAIERGRFDWETVAARYRITHLCLSPALQSQAVRAAETSGCWQEIYRDERAVLFEKVCKSSE